MVRSTAAQPSSRPPSVANGYSPIDVVHLARQTLGDKGLESEVLRSFDDALGIYLGRINRSKTREDLLAHLHTLKAAAKGIGATSVARLAATAERELKEGRAVDKEHLKQLEAAVSECHEWIIQLLAGQDE